MNYLVISGGFAGVLLACLIVHYVVYPGIMLLISLKRERSNLTG